MKHHAVIFDLDGTLIDSSEGIIHACIDTINELGLEPLSENLIKSCIGPPIADSIGRYVGYTQNQIDSFNNVFRPIYKNKYLRECTIYSGILDLLSKLKSKGVKTCIATNKRVDYTTTLLNDIGLSQYFDIIEAMDMDGTLSKTNMINNCINRLGISKEDAIMIGDAYSDRDAASACGVKFIGVRYGFGFRNLVNPDFTLVETVEELEKLL